MNVLRILYNETIKNTQNEYCIQTNYVAILHCY